MNPKSARYWIDRALSAVSCQFSHLHEYENCHKKAERSEKKGAKRVVGIACGSAGLQALIVSMGMMQMAQFSALPAWQIILGFRDSHS